MKNIEFSEDSIPSGPKLPILGHLHQIPSGKLQQFLIEASSRHPEGIFKIWFGKFPGLFVFDPDLVAELSDETRFRKFPSRALIALRELAGDGLFTAFTDEPNWGKAHRVLMPAFSQSAMEGYFGLIRDVMGELVAKWTSLDGEDIHVSDDMTRLTLESIAVAGFGQRFGSFERKELDPFLQAMGVALENTLKNLTRLPIQQKFAPKQERIALKAAIQTMNDLVDQVIVERREQPDPELRDLLNLMLISVDPETGENLSDLNIRYQVLTFLIAGHETTSGLLTFSLYLLLRHPHVLARAYAEIDRVLPHDGPIKYRDIAKLDVISRVLDESLRLWPTAPIFTVGPYEDEIIGGAHQIRKDRQLNIVIPALHRHPKAWDRPEEFDIERWLPEHDEHRHPHAYKPFGSGERACIGRQFALLEAKVALAIILQKFAISDAPGYRLRIKETLTIKPEDFLIQARRRRFEEKLVMGGQGGTSSAPEIASVAGAGQQMTVVYGTSLGTARDVAEQIAARGKRDGFETAAMSLDDMLAAPPEPGLLVIVTATYNGRAPDSAIQLERVIKEGRLPTFRWVDLQFAVLGIGNSQWPNYQAFPKLVDTALEAAGASRLVSRGEADGNGDFEGGVAAFVQTLWTALGTATSDDADTDFGVTFVDRATARLSLLPSDTKLYLVEENRELVTPAPSGLWDFTQEAPRSSTRHIRVQLPEGATYRTGDHLAVYARSRGDLVEAVINKLGINDGALVRLSGDASRLRHLPVGETVSVRQLLEDYVDLQETASRRVVQSLARLGGCPKGRDELDRLGGEAYQAEVADRRLTLLDLVRTNPALEVTLATFVALSPPILPRFYSIASSPLMSPGAVDLLVGTLSAPAWSGLGQHQGLTSSYLSHIDVGARLAGFVRTPNPSFAPPEDASLPLILIGAGTGFAPFRGFLQDREIRRAGGESIGTAELFFGCRHPDHDWFYREEVECWTADKIVHPHLAFSAVGAHSWRYVQDALWAQQERVWTAIRDGGSIYVCGDGRFMAPAVRDTLIRIHMHQGGTTYLCSSEWLEKLIREGRFHQDVFGS